MEMSRRKFLGSSAAAVIVAGTMARGKVFGANSRVRVCTIGFHGRGGDHIGELLKMKDDVEYVAVCDVDKKVLENGVKRIEKEQGKAPKG